MDELRHGQRLPSFPPPDPPWIRVDARSDGSRVAVLVHGEVDAHTCDQLRRELMAALDGGVRQVVVDVSGLTFCDLAGSDVLHHFADEALLRAVAVDVRGMSPLLSLIYDVFPPGSALDADRTPVRTHDGGAEPPPLLAGPALGRSGAR